jgi:ABC-type nitrate/sulfonate/bicarbonate transport system substrate-binding protein
LHKRIQVLKARSGKGVQPFYEHLVEWKGVRRSIMSVAIAFIIAVVVACAGCNRGPGDKPDGRPKKLVVAVGTWPASAALFVALEQGLFAEEGLDVILEPYPSGHLGLEAMLNGKADLATVGETPIVRAILDNRPVMVVATISRIKRAILIVARKDRGIGAAADLRGKRIGVVPGTTAEFYLGIFLTTAYLKPEEVHRIEIPTDDVVDALAGGEVDAVSTWTPLTTMALDRLGANAVVLDKPDLYRMSWNLVAGKELTLREPEVIERFLRAVIKANEFVSRQPARARAITALAVGIDLSALEKEWSDYDMTAVLDQSLILYLEDQSRWMAAKSVAVGALPNVLEHIYAGALNSVQPEAVRIIGLGKDGRGIE